MAEWLVLRARQVSQWDLAIISLIFVTIVAFGFDLGILAGLIAAVLLFIYQYSQVDMVRREITGAEYRSGVAARPGVLQQVGDEILIVQPSGFLFFGTAHRFRLHIQDRFDQIGAAGKGFLVIDFQQVTGIDSSASNSFDRLRQATAASDVSIVLTGLSAAARSTLLGGEDESGDSANLHVERDLESGVRWCEDAQLAAAGKTATESRPLAATLAELVGDRDAADVVGRYCERSVVTPDMSLVAQGVTSADIFFIESGNASVEIADGHGRPVYVATVGAGDFVGEIAFYLGGERSASVVAKDEMVVWRLSSEAIERLQAEAPAVALKFHRRMAAMLLRRLTRTSRHLSFVAG